MAPSPGYCYTSHANDSNRPSAGQSMAKKVEALVEPRMLAWARRSAGYDLPTAARKAHVKTDTLETWEQGGEHPSIIQLRKLGNVYKRPLAVFYLPEPPEDFQPVRDYRRLSGLEPISESPSLLYAIRRAYARREDALELLALVDESPASFDHVAELSQDPEDVGAQIRAILGVDYDRQVLTAAGYDTLNFWRRRFEDRGILVFQAQDVPLSTARGFSISLVPLPAVVANVKDSLNGRVFTMFHELAHILLRQGGVCDLDENGGRPADAQQVEIFCNHSAGAALVPSERLLAEPVVRRRPQRSDWPDEEVHWLADRYGVSREVVLRRLLIVGKTSQRFYEVQRQAYLEEYRAAEKKPGFALPHTMAVSVAGYAFVGLVLENFRQETISASDVAELLDVRLKHLSRIEALIGSAPPRLGAVS